MARSWPAAWQRVPPQSRAVAEQSKEEEKRRLMGGPGRGKKENKFEIQNGDVAGFKNSPIFLQEIDKINKNTIHQESLEKLLKFGHNKRTKRLLLEFPRILCLS